MLCVTWFSTRVVIYPYHCVLSAFIDYWEYSDGTWKSRIIAYILTSLMYFIFITSPLVQIID